MVWLNTYAEGDRLNTHNGDTRAKELIYTLPVIAAYFGALIGLIGTKRKGDIEKEKRRKKTNSSRSSLDLTKDFNIFRVKLTNTKLRDVLLPPAVCTFTDREPASPLRKINLPAGNSLFLNALVYSIFFVTIL